MIGLIGLVGLVGLVQQQSSPRAGWPCVGRPDPSMVQVSEASGGQVFLLDPSEVAASATLLMARDGLDETLRRVVGELEPGDRAFEVEVDASVERVLFSVSLQCLQAIEIVRPSGAIVAASDADVTWTAFQAGRQVGIRAPEAGTWQVRLAGKGLVFLVAHARTSLALEGARFVREGGRPGHEGLVADSTPAVPGRERLVEVRLTAGLGEPQFELRASNDAVLGRPALTPLPPDGDTLIYIGRLRVPTVPFRLVVTGRDARGAAVQRTQETLFLLDHSR